MADARQRTPDVLDAPGSDRSTIIDVEATRVPATSPARGALTSFVARRLPFLTRSPEVPQTLEVEEPQTRPFPLAWASFVAVVVVPASLILLYFAFVASNQYIAEMRLVVRMGRIGQVSNLSSMMSKAEPGGSGGGALPGGMGGDSAAPTDSGTAIENAQIVTSYVRSRAVVDELLKVVNLREMFTRPEADFYARLRKDASIEDLVDYWRTMTRATLDSVSGIVTIQVRAFRPEDAVEISRHVEAISEKLVNGISTRARADALRRATEEVERAQGVLLASLRELEKFRNREGIIDPLEAARQTGTILAKVLGEQLEAENQLFIASKSLAPDSATVRQLRTRADNLRKQVADIRAQLAGSDGQAANVAGMLARYEEVSVQQKLAQTLYAMAESGMERARIAAEAQSIYLSVFVKPNLPEDTLYPKRVQFTFLITIALLVGWSIAALIGASIQDHRLS